jgi:phosphoglucomutase
MSYRDRYEQWIAELPADDPMREELIAIRDNDEEIKERFYTEIEFGTAGLRGIRGAGTNRMNRLTVGRATQGIANYILASGEDRNRGMVLAYDCRYFSKEFAELAAQIFAGNGIKAYLFPSHRPTPELSFAIRSFAALGGINMTASHNPKEYNGYKVYWMDGAQISGEISDGMLREIQALDFFDEFKIEPLEDAIEERKVRMITEEMDLAYLDYVKSMRQRDDDEIDKTIPVVYTPLNGAGSIPMQKLAEELGYVNFFIVPEQKDPDPEFTTVGYPNPEDPKAFELSEALGREKGAEVLIATDPDSDRMAIEVLDGNGNYVPLNGNQTGALLIAYMARSKFEKGTLPAKAAMIKSIVTGNLGRAICEHYGIRVFEALTGFKNICGVIPKAEEMGYEYFFGYEESIGSAPGEEVRDKDGICAAMLIMELAAWCRKNGMTLGEYLQSLYRKFGFYAEDQVSFVLQGIPGAQRIKRIMDAFRSEKPQSFGRFTVKKCIDYLKGYEGIPASNVLIYHMTDGNWFAMRPSGTEPKIKFYYYAKSMDNEKEAKDAVEDMKEAVGEMVEKIE